MRVDVIYSASATAIGGRDGRARTSDGRLDILLSTPRELGGAGGSGNNPEELFAAAYAACFLNAMKLAAVQGALSRVSDLATVTATIGIGPQSEGGFGLEALLEVQIPDMAKREAEILIAAAHQICPYSEVTRGKMAVQFTLI